MTSLPAARIHLVITFFLVMCGALGGAAFGSLLGGRATSVVAAGAGGLGAGIGSFPSRRQVTVFLEPGTVPADGYAEGIADAVLVDIATYQAAAFPLTPGGLTEEERDARRTPAYPVAAFDGPAPGRTGLGGRRLDAVDQVDRGLNADRAQAALDAMSLTVHEHRRAR
ncbi:hypothetical protein ACFV0Y_24210 [Streptomyces sp. NPDC059569]|uniref:hypothetical protein n=1 Tax=Streptomyces sp. NPDC059569 TaxID=3346869 RepID=UPI0036C7A739